MPIAHRFIALSIFIACAGGCSASEIEHEPAVLPSRVTESADPEPRRLMSVEDVADSVFQALDQGDWDEAWLFWTTEAKESITQEEFVLVYDKCSPVTGLGFKITKVREVSATKAVVEWRRLNISGSHEFRLEGGKWRFQPSAAELAEYRLGAEDLIEKKTKDGTCG